MSADPVEKQVCRPFHSVENPMERGRSGSFYLNSNESKCGEYRVVVTPDIAGAGQGGEPIANSADTSSAILSGLFDEVNA